MRGKIRLLLFLSLAVMMTFAASAWAANVNVEVTGAPTTAAQGETKTFTINISATGSINLDKIPATVTVDTAYTAGGGSGTPNSTSVFSAPSTPAGGCVVNTSGANAGQCKPAQNVTDGPYAIGASVSVPANLAPGTYEITIAASATPGLDLPTLMPSFSLEVTAAGSAPSIEITTPADGANYKVNQPIMASVEITSAIPLSDIAAALNGQSVTLTPVEGEADLYEAALTLSQPGANQFTVFACNSVGCTTAYSNFQVVYEFGAFLPPITTAKFQSGRTLPVKFTVKDNNGPTAGAVATVNLDGTSQGTATVYYDGSLPYYQLEIKLAVPVGQHTVSVGLNAGTGSSMVIQVK